MTSGWGRTGLRVRLVAAVGAVVIVTVAAAFAVVYRQTSGQLAAQLDQSIRASAAQLAQEVRQGPHRSPAEVLAAAHRAASSQPYRNAAVLLFAIVPGHGAVSNHPELVSAGKPDRGETAAQQRLENDEARRLATPHAGYQTEMGPDVGRLRVYQQRVRLGGLTFYAGAAQPLEDVDRAQDEVLRSFALAGALAMVLALASAYLTAARISAPLRDASEAAAQIDAGDLSPRMELEPGATRELHVLADAFNHMLDRLAAAFEAQREFVADASHELRTPLTVIRGQLDLLTGSADVSSDEVDRVGQLVQTEIARLTRLTDDLLLLARSDSGDFLRLQPIELVPFINELWDGLSLTAARHFETGPMPDVTLRADPDRLAQALRNLGANAVAHTAAPDGLVRIAARRAGQRLQITVEDDGPGVPAEQRELVFDRFYRIDPSRARREGGAGLGLAIVRAIVEAHGGSVRVEDSAAGGASFEIDLPLGA